MSDQATRRGMQALLTVLGGTALLAGLFAVLTGADGQVGGGEVTASQESEFRFFAAFWAAYGVVALSTVRRIDSQAAVVRALALALFAAGLARGLAWIVDGRPHALLLVLLGLELAVPVALLAGQRRLAD